MNPWWVEQYVLSFALTLVIKKIILLQLKDIFTLYKQLYICIVRLHLPSVNLSTTFWLTKYVKSPTGSTVPTYQRIKTAYRIEWK